LGELLTKNDVNKCCLSKGSKEKTTRNSELTNLMQMNLMTDLAPSTYRKEKHFSLLVSMTATIEVNNARGRSHPEVIATNKVVLAINFPS